MESEMLEGFLFEKELENEISKYFNEQNDYKAERVSNITGEPIVYSNNTLMNLFSVDAEIDIQTILAKKYGSRVKHIGGKEVSDIEIEGTKYAFNVKVSSNNTSSVKLCSLSTPGKLNGREYRFLTLFYTLNDDKKSIKINRAAVFNYEYIKDIVSKTKDEMHLAKGKILEYLDRRNLYIEGEIEMFNPLTVENIKPSFNYPDVEEEIISNYFLKKKETSYTSFLSYFRQKYNQTSIENSVINLMEKNALILKGDVIESLIFSEEHTISAYQIVNREYNNYVNQKIDQVDSIKKLREYIVNTYGVKDKLTGMYISKFIHNDKKKLRGKINA